MRNSEKWQGDGISEMLIVDTFTRLIFGDDSDFDHQERSIIDALGAVDETVAVSDPAEVGEFLRALEVAEMIALVATVRARLERSVPVLAGANSDTADIQPHC